ncbi:MAG: ArsR/SmtB family transcription factor, partial [Actinomycetota bacterium]
SHHLRRLARDGLVTYRRDGRHVVYELASDDVYRLWRALQDVGAAHHAGLPERAQAYVGDRDEIDTIDRGTLRKWLREGRDQVVVIDVRPEQEYSAGHIEGAISAPPDRLDEVLPSLPARAGIVAYCRGRYCAYADQAVRRLRSEGRTAYRLEDGILEWKQPDS